MRFDWQQLSPRERQVLVRHFLFHSNTPANVTPEKVCEVMQKSHHHLTCYTTRDGKAVIVNRRERVSHIMLLENFWTP